jgi:hypothetical protein
MCSVIKEVYTLYVPVMFEVLKNIENGGPNNSFFHSSCHHIFSKK